MCSLDEVSQHLLCDFEVSNDPFPQGANGHNVLQSPAYHLFGFETHGFHLMRNGIESHDGRLVDHDSFAFGIDERISSAQVDREVMGKGVHRRAQTEHGVPLSNSDLIRVSSIASRSLGLFDNYLIASI